MLYFDHNSTTPVDSRVAAIFDRAQRECFGNASSIHRAGQDARQKLEQARRGIARHLGARESEIVFTSGGTESNNLAIHGVLKPGMHAITSRIEHPSVLEPFRQLEREGVSVTYVPVDGNGVVNPVSIAEALRAETALVSLMTANNETGVIQPVAEVARLLNGRNVLFHSDGVQAAGKMPLNLNDLGVDLFSISGHKVYAPKGFGALYVRKGTRMQSLHQGGRHERNLRAGTENVAGAMALEVALDLCSQEERNYLAQLRDAFERQMGEQVNSAAAPRLCNTSNILFPGISGEALLIALDMQGYCVSTGSACSSGSIEPSHVLLEMALTPKEARASMRFSFGRGNTLADVGQLAAAVHLATNKMREKQLV